MSTIGDSTFSSMKQNATRDSRPKAIDPSTQGLVHPVVESPYG